MKYQKNRKCYNFSKRQWQRLKGDRISRYDKVGAEFKKIRQKQFKAKCKYVLIRLIKGDEVEFPRFRKTDSWDW